MGLKVKKKGGSEVEGESKRRGKRSGGESEGVGETQWVQAFFAFKINIVLHALDWNFFAA